jgi:hypothetical protein
MNMEMLIISVSTLRQIHVLSERPSLERAICPTLSARLPALIVTVKRYYHGLQKEPYILFGTDE